MTKLLTIIGNRPQFVKSAILTRELQKHSDKYEEIVVNSGQHYYPELEAKILDQAIME